MTFFLAPMLRIERFPEKQPVHTFYAHVFYFARLSSCAVFLRSRRPLQTSTDVNISDDTVSEHSFS